MSREERWVATLFGTAENVTREHNVVSYDEIYETKRREALERDNHQCQNCQSEENLEVHHIEPIREYIESEIAHRLENLRTLCQDCHIDEHR